jgi:hypothetical protein
MKRAFLSLLLMYSLAVTLFQCHQAPAFHAAQNVATDTGASATTLTDSQSGTTKEGDSVINVNETHILDQSHAEISYYSPLKKLRGVLHVHSPYSHDACDGAGYVDGILNMACLDSLRNAMCQAKLDFAFLNDHPEFVSSISNTERLLYFPAKGDQLIFDNKESIAIANRMPCEGGGEVVIMAGYEHKHTLPLGVHKHTADPDFYFRSYDSIDDLPAKIQILKDAGAVTSVSHSESGGLSAEGIVEAGFDSMEWYNPHGSILNMLGGDILDKEPAETISLLLDFGLFIFGDAHPDLIYLKLLPYWPEAGFTKWKKVLQSKAITGVLGSDVHQNVGVAPQCDGAALSILCEALAGQEAGILSLVVNGGGITLNDGERFDSYGRVFRWVQNQVFAKSNHPVDIAQALRKGRNIGEFTVFGDATDFEFYFKQDETIWLMGDSIHGAATLHTTVPKIPSSRFNVPFDTSQQPEVYLKVFRTDSNGTELLLESSQSGANISRLLESSGAYHVEVWIKPHYLKKALADQTDMTERSYLWLITNPVWIE